MELKMLLSFMTISNILRPFGIMYGLLVYVVCGHLVYFYVLVCLDREKSGNPGSNIVRIDPNLVGCCRMTQCYTKIVFHVNGPLGCFLNVLDLIQASMLRSAISSSCLEFCLRTGL
jgi:hypothetical protein